MGPTPKGNSHHTTVFMLVYNCCKQASPQVMETKDMHYCTKARLRKSFTLHCAILVCVQRCIYNCRNKHHRKLWKQKTCTTAQKQDCESRLRFTVQSWCV